jgi:threonine/homoserine/homoserine lactone efflux protein
VVFALIAFSSDVMYALLADVLAGRLRRTGAGARARRYVSGGIFVALGITAAAARRAT